jgi:hypothetical protein
MVPGNTDMIVPSSWSAFSGFTMSRLQTARRSSERGMRNKVSGDFRYRNDFRSADAGALREDALG